MTEAPICVRWSFRPERAAEFLSEITVDGVKSQPTITQVEYSSIDEVMAELNVWKDAVEDVSALVDGRVVNLSDHPAQEDKE